MNKNISWGTDHNPPMQTSFNFLGTSKNAQSFWWYTNKGGDE